MNRFPDSTICLSPNFDERTLPISMIVLHYTGMETGEMALARLCDEKSKVSAHYLVQEDGSIINMVDENKRAWHAGVSWWNGTSNVNSASIGIEIVNGGHDFGLPDFPKEQIRALIKLCKHLKSRYKINDFNIVAHSDIAPDRKSDPGEKFPWDILADNDIGIYPAGEFYKPGAHGKALFAQGEQDKDILIVQKSLAYLGYKIQKSGILDKQSMQVITAFQRRYRQDKIDGLIDRQVLRILLLLASYKKKAEGATFVG